MIELLNVGIRFGPFHLHEVTASIESGEYFIVTGPAGCGKTVLLETLLGLNRHYHGRILLDGVSMRGVPVEARSMAYVPQEAALFPHLSVQGNLLYGVRERGLRRVDVAERLDQLLDTLGLRPLLTRTKVAGLSASEQRKIALARALLIEPAVLVLDEPLASLDDDARRELALELKRMNAEHGVTVVHATRDLDEALALGTRVGVIVEGRLQQVSRVEGPHLGPANAAVAHWMAGRNVLPAVVKDVDAPTSKATVTYGETELVASFHAFRPVPGSAVFVGLRPQEVSVLGAGQEAPADATVLDATVEAVLHYGGAASVAAKVAGMPTTLEVAVPLAVGQSMGLTKGASVRIAIPSSLLWVVPRD